MNQKEFGRTVNDQLINQVDEEVADNKLDEMDLPKASASCYDRLGKYRTKFQKEEILIAVGLYLILTSVAMVVL